MGSILNRSLIFVALLIAGLVLYTIWFSMKAERHDEFVVPYLNENLSKITSWRYDELAPLLSPQAAKDLDNEQAQLAYRSFARLGKLLSVGKPQFVAEKREFSEALGEINLVSYSVPLEFETGSALMKVKFVSDDKAYYIHHFGFHSEIFNR